MSAYRTPAPKPLCKHSNYECIVVQPGVNRWSCALCGHVPSVFVQTLLDARKNIGPIWPLW